MSGLLRQTLRSLRRSPAFVLTVVATLGIGIGFNAAIFTVVDCVLLRPLGYRDADRIVALQTHFDKEDRSIPRLGGDDYRDLSRDVKGLEAAAYYQAGEDGVQLGGAAVYLPVASVSPAFGKVMGVEPVAGRDFKADADGHEALVSSGFAREHFGSARGALGRAVKYDGALRTVVGVLPEGFSFPGKTAVWFEAKLVPEVASRTAYNQRAVAKRRVGVSEQQLAAEMATFSRQLQQGFTEDRTKSLETVSLQEEIVGKVRPTLRLLMGSVAVILLILGANVTHLQLVRATRQLRAITIRTALGASRALLAGRALMEAVLLASAGCALALLLAVPALRLLVRLAPPELPRLADVHVNFTVLLFSFLASLLLMSATAVLPVWRSWHIDPVSAMRQDASRGTEDRGSSRLRNSFVVAEVALTVTLSVAAILLARQLMAQARQDLGFNAESLVVLDAHAIPEDNAMTGAAVFSTVASGASERRLARLAAAIETVGNVPGVEAAAAISGAPMSASGSSVRYAVKGRGVFPGDLDQLPDADVSAVSPGLFTTMGMPLLRGRDLAATDRLGTPVVVVINQTLARQVFPGQDPIGQQIMCGYDSTKGWWTIVGVVGDIRDSSPATPPYPTFYPPVAQHPGRAADMQIIARTHMDPAAMVETLRTRLTQTHPEIAVKATTMRQSVTETTREAHFRSVLFGSFAAISILLAAIGMYGVTTYSVAQRSFEFGLRVALGASRSHLLLLVLRNALAVALLGVGIGIVLSLTLMRVLRSVAGELPAFDAAAYALATGAVLSIALLATLLPARTAGRTDPMQALRGE